MNQQSDLANKLGELLNKMTQEEFEKEWSKVTSLKLESVSLEDACKNLKIDTLQKGTKTCF